MLLFFQAYFEAYPTIQLQGWHRDTAEGQAARDRWATLVTRRPGPPEMYARDKLKSTTPAVAGIDSAKTPPRPRGFELCGGVFGFISLMVSFFPRLEATVAPDACRCHDNTRIYVDAVRQICAFVSTPHAVYVCLQTTICLSAARFVFLSTDTT